MLYGAVNHAVLDLVPSSARTLLDLGCGTGSLGEAVRARQACSVTGVTWSEEEAARARARLDEVRVADLSAWTPSATDRFDCIVASHVLEHLPRPELVLERIARAIAPGGSVVVALPNVLHWKQRLEFLRGDFRYTEGGTMDRTHLRFFDLRGARALVTEAGLTVRQEVVEGGFPLSRLLPARAWLDRLAVAARPGLFGTQIVLRCEVAGDRR